ncbi:hypothetical protein Goshw_027531 [Gossypium schwendimanii]|uniref:RNase H type-1 domain-containing protein n=1 Tax=Gossypium schwendimanii TaxID=34291 RepID=A0A7J9NCB4_GOSSC|nr:hypothetical protein [Gossypium schwendimanii]
MRVLISMRTRDLVWDPPPMGRIKFNVVGFVMNEIAACGGVLRDDKGVVSALFSGSCATRALEMAVLMAIKEVTKMVIELIRKENLFANFEGSLRRMPEVRIEVTNQGKNGMAKALAKVGLSRNTLFRAYW